MTEAAVAPVKPMSLFSRAIGIITAPKATYENIVAAPRPFGILLIVAFVIGAGTAIPQMTEAGRDAVVQMQLKAMEARGSAPTPQAAAQMQSFSRFFPYITFGSTFIVLPVITLFMTALYWAFFNVALGGTATFKQVLAVVSHAQVIAALGIIAGIYFMLRQPTMSIGGPFNLGVLAPTLEESSKLAKFLGNVGLFGLWGVFVNAIGFSVLYRRKTAGIFIALLVVFLGFTYLGSMFRG